jgi:antitoxin component of MazEF toxin-antitoxin module
MMEAVVSKWGNSSAVRIPKQYLIDLGIADNDKVNISRKGNIITIEKPTRVRSLRELALAETGMSLEDYVKENPYDNSCYIEFGRVGREEI